MLQPHGMKETPSPSTSLVAFRKNHAANRPHRLKLKATMRGKLATVRDTGLVGTTIKMEVFMREIG